MVKDSVGKEKKRNPERSVNSTGGKQVLVTGESCRGTCYLFVDSGSSVDFVSLSFIKRVGLEKEVKP